MFEGECSIRKAGIGEDGRVGILLTAFNPPNAFAETWFLARDDFKKEFLAIAMAAINGNKRVFAKVKNEKIERDTIMYFGLVKD
jgi:hypothetical protein